MKEIEKEEKGLGVKKDENFGEWFIQVVKKAKLADYGPIKGFMILRPKAYFVWEKIQEEFNKTLTELNIENAYFPLLIPESFFKKEAEHAEGFAPELAYVENTEEGERLVLRPTSETIIYDSYSKWIRSWRDLPLKINQWANVLRWEVKQTKPFLRTREFLWQEGHDVFATNKEADEDMFKILSEYKKLVEGLLAIPVLSGKKSKVETFPGAKTTTTIEALMPDGRALQCGTSHNLGQGFAKGFNIKFLDKEGKSKYVWQTSWGISTRLIGAMIMIHSDDKGLVLPPKVAKNKVVIIPILFEKSKEFVLKKAEEIKDSLKKFSPLLDSREDRKPGFKFSEWEMEGIPIRIEIGPKDLDNEEVVLVRRDTNFKEKVKWNALSKKIEKVLEEEQRDLFKKAETFLYSRIDQADSLEELKKKLKEGKLVKVYMKDDKEIEEKLKKLVGANSRIIEDSDKSGSCVVSGEIVNTLAFIAKSY